VVANLSRFLKSHPVAQPPADFEPDGTWYSMIASGGALYAVEPNHGELDRISTSGTVTRVVDVSASQGHSVPTSVAEHAGRFFLGNLGTFPIVPGTQKVLRLDGDSLRTRVSGLTAVVDLVFHDGDLFVLETSTAPGLPTPETGRVLRVDGFGGRHAVATGLTLPTAMTFGPDGALYISNRGFGFPPGAGQIVKVSLD
jgi:hypothetical protein